MDKYKIDGHKLNYHLSRVNDWMEQRTVYPIYVEISPAGACNHRCNFCAVDYIGYQNRFLDSEILMNRLSEMGRLGIRSVMFAGEGEPLLHKDLSSIIQHTKASGIDVAITTNAIPLTEKWASLAMGSITWIKASINAGTPQTYAKIHGTQERDYSTAINNLSNAIQIRNENNLKCTVGAQMLLLPENAGETITLAQTLKEIGCDYLVIKPYSQHKSSITRIYEDIDYTKFNDLKPDLDTMNDNSFSIVYRENTMTKLQEAPPYSRCQATPHFWAYIMADGSVYGCSAYLKDSRFNYGNILEKSFMEIWEGETRRKNIHFVENELDIKNCRTNCRMDEVNRYLWDLKHPVEHANFI